MACYLVGYDLNKPGSDYADVIEEIKRIGTWWHCLDSTWIIAYNGPATAIRDALTPYLDANDELLVVRLSGEAAWTGFSKECSEWLKSNL